MLHFYCLKRIIKLKLLIQFYFKNYPILKKINSKGKIGCIEIIINEHN